MPIENLLTKIIVNTNKLPYEKQKQLLQITQDWIDQELSGNKDVTSIKDASSPAAESNKASNTPYFKEEHQPLELESANLISIDVIPDLPAQPVSTKNEDLVVNIIEERAYERKMMSIPIDFVSAGQLYKEVTKDLSAGGMFIKTKKHSKFKKNQKISMVFELSQNKKPFKLTGKIIRVETDGIAVQFHNISPFECVAIEEELNNHSSE